MNLPFLEEKRNQAPNQYTEALFCLRGMETAGKQVDDEADAGIKWKENGIWSTVYSCEIINRNLVSVRK